MRLFARQGERRTACDSSELRLVGPSLGLVNGEKLVLKGSGGLFPQLVMWKVEGVSYKVQILKAGIYLRCLGYYTVPSPASFGFG